MSQNYSLDLFGTPCKVIELSHKLLPSEEEYNLQVYNRFVEELQPEYERPADAWYIMSEVELWSHVGTHIEVPYHYLKDGIDCSEITLDHVMGSCVLLDFTDKEVLEPISRNDMEERGSGVKPGDIVFIRTDLYPHYRTERSHDRPYFEVEAIQWMVERDIACLGVDCSGIEKRDEPVQPNHKLLFEHGIPLIEHLAYLDKIRSERFFVLAVPWRVKNLEASPVSVVALIPGEG
ncbi:MAG: cyclase family protein [Anaerolineales bacterium]|jgi:arylformamidase